MVYGWFALAYILTRPSADLPIGMVMGLAFMSGYARAQWARLTPLVPAVLLVAYSWSAAAAGRVPWPMVGICIGVGYMFWLIGDWVRDAEDR